MATAVQTHGVRVNIGVDAYREYEHIATRTGAAPEDVMARRLEACLKHDSAKPLYFTDDQRKGLERLLGRNFDTPEQVIKLIEQLIGVTVEGTSVFLKPDLLSRLRSRCFGQPFNSFIGERVTEGLEQYAGMR